LFRFKGCPLLAPEQKGRLWPGLKRRERPERPQDFSQTPTSIPNLIQGIIIDLSNKVWVSDFTYLSYHGRFIYLATLENLYTQQIMGRDVSIRHNADLAAQALLNALNNYPSPQIARSDQGSEYRSEMYLDPL